LKVSVLGLVLIGLSVGACSNRPPGVAPGEGEERAAVETGTQVVLLGTGTPGAEPDRSGSSVAVVASGNVYLVDFGPGVVRRASAAYLLGVPELEPSNLKRAFVTHLHSDHTAGFPDLILTPWVAGRSEPLEVYGPPGIKSMTDHILKAYEEDILVRVFGLEEANPEGCKVIAREVEPGVVYEDSNVTVKAFEVEHGSWLHAYGYRFETQDRTIVISGDTAPSESLIKNASGCDVLIHEVYSQSGFEYGPPSFQEYHSQSHTSTVELAEMARRVKPGLLVLYHQLLFGASEEELLEEIRQHYQGRVVSGRDLDVY